MKRSLILGAFLFGLLANIQVGHCQLIPLADVMGQGDLDHIRTKLLLPQPLLTTPQSTDYGVLVSTFTTLLPLGECGFANHPEAISLVAYLNGIFSNISSVTVQVALHLGAVQVTQLGQALDFMEIAMTAMGSNKLSPDMIGNFLDRIFTFRNLYNTPSVPVDLPDIFQSAEERFALFLSSDVKSVTGLSALLGVSSSVVCGVMRDMTVALKDELMQQRWNQIVVRFSQIDPSLEFGEKGHDLTASKLRDLAGKISQASSRDVTVGEVIQDSAHFMQLALQTAQTEAPADVVVRLWGEIKKFVESLPQEIAQEKLQASAAAAS